MASKHRVVFLPVGQIKGKLLRAGFEPATYGFPSLSFTAYSPPLYQLSYRRDHIVGAEGIGYETDAVAAEARA